VGGVRHKKRGNEVNVFCIIYENRRMKPAEIVLRRGRGRRENDGVNLSYIVSAYPAQLLYGIL
jgi:hypothetical protein